MSISNNYVNTLINRRKFIEYGTVMAGGVALATLPAAKLNSTLDTEIDTQHWHHRPLRILQTVLRETDAANYNANEVVDYMLKASCNTLVVNAGGIVDFFQNPLPAANINRFMKKRDILEEITTACSKEGIRVIGRIDFRGVEEHIYLKHPDWFSVDANNQPIRLDYTRPRLYASCYNGYYRNDHAEEFIRYLLTNYTLDGIWHNSIGVGGICYCKQCSQNYKAATGANIPEYESSRSALKMYMQWKSQVANRHMQRMKDTVKSFGEGKAYTAEVFSMFESGSLINSGIDLYNARDHFDFLVSVAFLTQNSEHIHYEDLNYANTIIRFLKSMAPEKEAVILYGGNGTAHRYVMDPPNDLKIWLWQALAAGGRFWNCNFTGMHPNATLDRRNAFNNTEAYEFVKTHEKILAQQAPVTTIGIYYSKSTRLLFREESPEGDRFEDAINGMVTILSENHIQFDFIPDEQVNEEKLSKYKLILLPNVKCMSEKELDNIKKFIRDGGALLATYETSLYDENGMLRGNFGLSELFGCDFSGKKENTRKDHYQRIAQPDHPIVSQKSSETDLLINAGFTLLCRAQKLEEIICSYVPVVHNQPPEKAWVERWKTEYPTLVEHKYGKGKVLYFANQPDRITTEFGHPDVRDLLFRGIDYLAGTSIPLKTNAPESVHIGLTKSLENPGDFILSMVNTTSGPGRPVQRLVPVDDIEVELRMEGKSLIDHKVLRSQGDFEIGSEDQVIKLKINNLEDFFAIHLKLE
jgi:hypothetical protein